MKRILLVVYLLAFFWIQQGVASDDCYVTRKVAAGIPEIPNATMEFVLYPKSAGFEVYFLDGDTVIGRYSGAFENPQTLRDPMISVREEYRRMDISKKMKAFAFSQPEFQKVTKIEAELAASNFDAIGKFLGKNPTTATRKELIKAINSGTPAGRSNVKMGFEAIYAEPSGISDTLIDVVFEKQTLGTYTRRAASSTLRGLTSTGAMGGYVLDGVLTAASLNMQADELYRQSNHLSGSYDPSIKVKLSPPEPPPGAVMGTIGTALGFDVYGDWKWRNDFRYAHDWASAYLDAGKLKHTDVFEGMPLQDISSKLYSQSTWDRRVPMPDVPTVTRRYSFNEEFKMNYLLSRMHMFNPNHSFHFEVRYFENPYVNVPNAKTHQVLRLR